MCEGRGGVEEDKGSRDVGGGMCIGGSTKKKIGLLRNVSKGSRRERG